MKDTKEGVSTTDAGSEFHTWMGHGEKLYLNMFLFAEICQNLSVKLDLIRVVPGSRYWEQSLSGRQCSAFWFNRARDRLLSPQLTNLIGLLKFGKFWTGLLIWTFHLSQSHQGVWSCLRCHLFYHLLLGFLRCLSFVSHQLNFFCTDLHGICSRFLPTRSSLGSFSSVHAIPSMSSAKRRLVLIIQPPVRTISRCSSNASVTSLSKKMLKRVGESTMYISEMDSTANLFKALYKYNDKFLIIYYFWRMKMGRSI